MERPFGTIWQASWARGAGRIALGLAAGVIAAGVVAGAKGVLLVMLAAIVLAIGWLIGRAQALRGTAVAMPAAPVAAARPDPGGLIEAIEEPALLLEGPRIFASNAAARDLIAATIDGAPVRLAIRHPAAAALLAGENDAPVDVTGIGGHERPWTLTARDTPGGLRLLRLEDRAAGIAAERMRVDFVANASHELRTPLAGLIGFIETLEDDQAGADRALRTRFLGIMAVEARRMRQLIDDLMSLSRIEADRFVSLPERIDMAALAHQVVAELRAAGSADRLEDDIADTLPAIAGDRSQLSQLLHNVIGNALKYSDADEPVRLSVQTSATGAVVIAVSDRGAGIAAEHIPRLTERFYRVDQHRSRAKGGTGLGLAIVKHIVERHRGRLEIASAPGKGTTVTTTLPAAA